MIACPKCRGYMFTNSMRGVEIDWCTRCDGMWLDRGELAQLAQTSDDAPEEGQNAQDTKYACPRCGSNLLERPYSKKHGLLIDVCRECNGVYLDRGELKQIQSFAQSMDTVFTPERKQAQDKRARFNEAYAAVYHTAEPAAKETLGERTAYIRNVYALLVLTLAITVVGAIIGMANDLARRFFIPAIILEIVVFLVTLGVRRIPYLNVTMLCTYTFLSGFTLAAVLARYVALGYTACIWQAMAVTTAVFIALSLYVHITKKDFTWMGGMLFTILLGLVITGFVFLFFPGALRMFIWSVVGAVTFCGYILYDTSKIILKYDTSEVVSAVIDLYLDIINLFLDLLRILAYLQGRR